MNETPQPLTVGDLRRALADLPDDARVLRAPATTKEV